MRENVMLKLLLLAVLLGSLVAGINGADNSPCQSQGAQQNSKQQKLSLTVMNIELIGLSLCEVDNHLTQE